MRAILLFWFAILQVATAAASEITGQITLNPGFYGLWKSPREFAEVLIADTNVVDGAPASNNMNMRFLAKASGITNVVVLDAKGDAIANLVVVVTNREINTIHIHSKIGNLQGFYAYQCSPICARVPDKFEGEERLPPPPVPPPIIIVAPQRAPTR